MFRSQPLPGESFVFTEFSGQPQCFLTEEPIVRELATHGFDPDPSREGLFRYAD